MMGSKSDHDLFSIWDNQTISASGGTGAIRLELLSGAGKFDEGSGLFVPYSPGISTIRATDSLGVFSDSEIQVQ